MTRLLQRLRRSPGFTLTALLTLAVGIGGTTAVFSVGHAAFLRGLPFKAADRIDFVWLSKPKVPGHDQWEFSFPTFRDVSARNHGYEALAAVRPQDVVLTGRGDAERLTAQAASANFFDVLGVTAGIGRTFGAGEDQPGRQFVTVLSHRLWQRRFGGDPGIVGQPLVLGGVSYTVIGVMPKGFEFRLRDAELWLPLLPAKEEAEDRDWSVLTVIGRRRAGVTLQAAHQELETTLRQLESQFPKSYMDLTIRLIPIREQYYGAIRGALWALLGAAGCVLLIGCVNLANLLQVRAAERRRELAIRTALGASATEIVRQLLLESLVLAGCGAAAGLGLAALLARLLTSVAPADSGVMLPEAAGLDASVVAFAFGLALLAALGFGLAPALAAARAPSFAILKDTERGSAGARTGRVHGLLVAVETALALALAVVAALLVQTFLGLQRVPPGYQPQGVLTMRLIPAPEGLSAETAAGVIAFWDSLIEDVEGLPGVESAGAVNYLPGYNEMSGVRIAGRPLLPPGQDLSAHFAVASPGYFRTMKIPILRGRVFDPRDDRTASRVVVLSETAARQFFPDGENPIGQRLAMNVLAEDFSVFHEIVGVVGDVRDQGLARPALPQLYWCSRQDPDPPMDLVVRVKTEPLSLVSAVRARARAIRPDVPVYKVTTLERRLAQSLWVERLSSLAAAAFGGLALALAGIGVYGVNAQSVERRTREIAVRMALGAQPSGILTMVVGQGMRPVGWGVLAGLVGAALGSRALAALLYGVVPTDPATYLGAIGLLALVALVSLALPAWRATRIESIKALRQE